jgi:hypothetical protein
VRRALAHPVLVEPHDADVAVLEVARLLQNGVSGLRRVFEEIPEPLAAHEAHVGVDDEAPLGEALSLLEAQAAVVAEVAPLVLRDQAPQLFGDCDGVVVASRVDHEDLVAGRERLDAPRQDFGLVPDHHDADHPFT